MAPKARHTTGKGSRPTPASSRGGTADGKRRPPSATGVGVSVGSTSRGAWQRPVTPARAHTPAHTSQMEQLRVMGFSEAASRDALSKHAWDVNRALDWLLSQSAGASSPRRGFSPGRRNDVGLGMPTSVSGQSATPLSSSSSSTASGTWSAPRGNSRVSSESKGRRSGGAVHSETDRRFVQEGAAAFATVEVGRNEAGGDGIQDCQSDRRCLDRRMSPPSAITTSLTATDVSVDVTAIREGARSGDLTAVISRNTVEGAEVRQTSLEGEGEELGSTDWQVLFGARETALEVGVGAGLPSVKMLGAVSQDVGVTSEAIYPLVRERLPREDTIDPVGVDDIGKPLRRVCREWLADATMDVLGAHVGDFVCAWTSTETEQGWIYAEKVDVDGSKSRSGWIPADILEETPKGRAWMQAVMSWSSPDKQQMEVTEGSILLVHTAWRSELGWMYAELVRRSGTSVDASSVCAGWIPDFCLNSPCSD
eukprot:TRINITY_DN43459_c0_g1_i1.p1 TRINITY_DN43459_c0_g1~~TRINITY_DN43459_c0_g1_i1.p1  ORF type:complete len:480 (+),score=70.79 TRINITY_DN43459_c0_g1_i1:98-1537(+)